ncbi:MAG: NYN domain-containing protein [Coriobacteriaceae bacterium]|nr:NYN domain-containing protein [Coriobacteriaceae bacterium]
MAEQTRIALFVDADNASPKSIPAIMRELTGKYGEVTYRRVYRNWHIASDKWNDMLVRYSMQPVYQASNARGKNSSDIKMIIDAMDALYAGTAECFCFVSSDSDFTSLAVRLREGGKTVLGIGERDKVKNDSALARACSKFIYVENLMDDHAPEDEPDEEQPSQAASSPSLTSESDIADVIADIITTNADEDGSMNLSQLKQAIVNRRPDFDVRTYGFNSFSKFLTGLGGFELTPPDAPDSARVAGVKHRTEEVFGLVRAYVIEGGRNGRTLPEIGSAINSAFPGQRIRELGYTRMSKLLADVPDVGLSTREDGTVVAVPEE